MELHEYSNDTYKIVSQDGSYYRYPKFVSCKYLRSTGELISITSSIKGVQTILKNLNK